MMSILFDILTNRCNSDKILSFIILNHTPPIKMRLSYKKITVPQSDVRSTDLFVATCSFNVLGIIEFDYLNQTQYIKPIALWDILNTNETYILK